jgi:CrcB protein
VTHWVLVGVGGALGAVGRYGLSGVVHGWFPRAAIPLGTLAVNVLGCLLIGVVMGLSDVRDAVHPEVRTFLVPGILGGFTTFSAFGHETVALMRDGDPQRALANVAVQVLAGLACTWIGYELVALR